MKLGDPSLVEPGCLRPCINSQLYTRASSGARHGAHTQMPNMAAPIALLATTVGYSPGGQSTIGQPRHYSESRMFGAPKSFASANVSVHLRRKRPLVLKLDGGPPALLDIDLGSISGPPSLGPPARAREMGIFNPSLAPAPPGLCPRCAYVAALRVDPLHQCHDASPLLKIEPDMPKVAAANAWFKGTAIAILDERLNLLRWTWLLNAPQFQVHPQPLPSRWFVPVGASDRFPPPWAKAVYDVRVISMDGHLFVSYVCRRCDFSIAELQLTAKATSDGGLHELRAWQSHRYGASLADAPWAQGRNQALFVGTRAPGLRAELLVQPWISKIASFGAPDFEPLKVVCGKPKDRLPGRQAAGFKVCGATPAGTSLDLQHVANVRTGGVNALQQNFGTLALVGNNSQAELSRAAVGGFRLSTTSNLVRISRNGCAVHLGVGHVHRREGELNLQAMPRARRPRRRARGTASSLLNGTIFASLIAQSPSPTFPFQWGSQYTHFFYALEARAPFRVVATSGEFCLEAAQQPGDCESIQFVSGISLAQEAPAAAAGVDGPIRADGSGTLLLSYGVNDCEAKVGRIVLARILDMLEPLSDTESCLTSPGMRPRS